MLKVKSIFGPTIQGEGTLAGTPAIFVRFSGCNMWDGKTETRASSGCPFCDTDFRAGQFMSAGDIVREVDRLRGIPLRPLLVVLTGGEPLLQPEKDLNLLTDLLNLRGYAIQLETNGTRDVSPITDIDYVTVSPKVSREKLGIDFVGVDCLKVLYPHPTVRPEEFQDMVLKDEYAHIDFCLQPIDVPESPADTIRNLRETVRKVKELGYPWRLSLQTHKILGEE